LYLDTDGTSYLYELIIYLYEQYYVPYTDYY
jgi:hypothetical protein